MSSFQSFSALSDVSLAIAKATEKSLLAQLNDFISRGLIVVEYGEHSFVQHYDRNEITYSRSVNLRLKDREYIEELEAENVKLKETLRDKLPSIRAALSDILDGEE